MPTAAKLIAGICFAILGYFGAIAFNVTAGPENGLGQSIFASAAGIGFCCGWFVLGRNPGLGGFDSVWLGMSAAIFSLAFACVLYGLGNMFDGLRGADYNTPTQAILTWLRVSVYLFTQTISVPVWSILLVGGALSGRLAGIANYRWT